MLLQPPLVQGDGPISLIMAPTRELVVQIGKDIRRFSKALALSVVCAYGGSAVAGQIADLKRGAEVRYSLACSVDQFVLALLHELVNPGGTIKPFANMWALAYSMQ